MDLPISVLLATYKGVSWVTNQKRRRAHDDVSFVADSLLPTVDAPAVTKESCQVLEVCQTSRT